MKVGYTPEYQNKRTELWGERWERSREKMRKRDGEERRG